MSRHKLYSDECGGPVTVTIKPIDSDACRGKDAVMATVSRGRGKTWRTRSPICVFRDPYTRAGARAAAEAAVGFYEDKRCPVGLAGARRRRRR